jgi:hypothetical protein
LVQGSCAAETVVNAFKHQQLMVLQNSVIRGISEMYGCRREACLVGQRGRRHGRTTDCQQQQAV